MKEPPATLRPEWTAGGVAVTLPGDARVSPVGVLVALGVCVAGVALTAVEVGGVLPFGLLLLLPLVLAAAAGLRRSMTTTRIELTPDEVRVTEHVAGRLVRRSELQALAMQPPGWVDTALGEGLLEVRAGVDVVRIPVPAHLRHDAWWLVNELEALREAARPPRLEDLAPAPDAIHSLVGRSGRCG